MSFFAELKRRNVVRVAVAYIVSGWLLLQLTEVLTELLDLPDVAGRFVVMIVVIGFPLALIFAWAFELTPEGIKRDSEVDRAKSITPQTGRKLDRSIIIILVIAVLLLIGDRFLLGQRDTTDTVSPPAIASSSGEVSKPGNSVAVLPFINLSDDAQNEYFSDGISEELLNVLVRIEGLRVPSRTSSFTFKGSNKKLSEIGAELEVDHVLEGSVRRAGDRIRVTAQLIEVNTDTHLWSETYTRELDDIFAVQDEIAQAIVKALQLTLTGPGEQRLADKPTDNVEAYNKYLQGRFLWHQRSRQGLAQAVRPLQEAVELDPNFERAWAALADVYLQQPEYRVAPARETAPKAKQAVSRALELNPDSAQALTTRAYIKAVYDFDYDGAKKDFERAIELEPGYATAHQWYGEILAAQRKIDAAIAKFDHAATLDPLAPIMPHVAGWTLMLAGRADEALVYYKQALAINPQFQPTLGNLILTYLVLGNYAQAREQAAIVQAWSPVRASALVALIDARENPALKPAAIAAMKDSAIPDQAVGKAIYYIMLDEPELALDVMEQALEEMDPYSIHANRVVYFDPLRDNPRYQAFLAKMNLWP